MYKISDFSRITSLTIKALRYYDEEGLLRPSFRDPENGYRYYSQKDYERAGWIYQLKELEFSIAEIREVLNNCEKEEDLSSYFAEKKQQIEERVRKEKELIRKLNLYYKPKRLEERSMEYEIIRKETEAVMAAVLRYEGTYSDVGKHIGELYKAVKNEGKGEPFCCYYDMEYKEVTEIELCVPVKRSVTSGKVETKIFPEGKVISTIHVGSYEKLKDAYKALLDYAEENKLKLLTPVREIYRKGPGMIFKGNENQYVTEILLPYED